MSATALPLPDVRNAAGVCSAEEDTHLLAQVSADVAPAGGRCLDLGTGSGYVAIYLAQRGLQVDAIDISERALELAQQNVARNGVTVNTISPGYIGTKMVMAIPQEILDSKILPQIPVSRLGKPEEIAGLVAYLSSEEAAFVTGANISINGGQHMF